MKQNKQKHSVFETMTGKYSARKIPHWKTGATELLEYLNFNEREEELILKPIHLAL